MEELVANLTKCEDLAVWEENGKVWIENICLIFFKSKIFVSFFSNQERDGDAVQVRLVIEKGCDLMENGGGEDEKEGEQLKEVLMEEFGWALNPEVCSDEQIQSFLTRISSGPHLRNSTTLNKYQC